MAATFQPTNPTDSIPLDGIAGRLAEAQDAGVPEVSILGLRGVVRQAAERIAETDQFVARVQADDNLSEKGKQDRTTEVIDLTRSLVEKAIGDVQARVHREIRKANDVAVEPPIDDPVLLEQKLMAARHDAELALASETELLAALSDLARNGDPVTRHLVLATPWPTAYLRSRGAGPFVMQNWPRTLEALRLEITQGEELAAGLRRLAHVPRLFESFVRRHYPVERSGVRIRE